MTNRKGYVDQWLWCWACRVVWDRRLKRTACTLSAAICKNNAIIISMHRCQPLKFKSNQIKITVRRSNEKCWVHSPLRAAVTLPFTRCRYCRTPAIAIAQAACDVHDNDDNNNNDNAWQRGSLWPHGMGPMTVDIPQPTVQLKWDVKRGHWNAGVENARVEITGAITYGKPSKQKTQRYYECLQLLERNGLRWSLNNAHEQRSGVHTLQVAITILHEYSTSL